MDNLSTSKIGTIGELKAMAFFAERGYQIFVPLGNGASVDFVALIEGSIKTISVKTTRTRESNSQTSWKVNLRQSHYNSATVITKAFDPTMIDYLAVYILPKDKLVVIDAKSIKSRISLSIQESYPYTKYDVLV